MLTMCSPTCNPTQAVLKPIEGLLSIGVVRVESETHLRKVFQDVTEQMEGMYMTRDGGMASIKPGEKLPAGAHALKAKVCHVTPLTCADP
jgi:hypothetical protein